MNNNNIQRSFDMIVYLTKDEEHQFLNIDKQEYDVLIKYLALKKIKIKNESGSAKLMDIEPTITVNFKFYNI